MGQLYEMRLRLTAGISRGYGGRGSVGQKLVEAGAVSEVHIFCNTKKLLLYVLDFLEGVVCQGGLNEVLTEVCKGATGLLEV